MKCWDLSPESDIKYVSLQIYMEYRIKNVDLCVYIPLCT